VLTKQIFSSCDIEKLKALVLIFDELQKQKQVLDLAEITDNALKKHKNHWDNAFIRDVLSKLTRNGVLSQCYTLYKKPTKKASPYL